MTTPATAILADDLTGACDAAAPFATYGLRTWIAWNAANFGEPTADLISACTKSRNHDAKVAAEATRLAARNLSNLGATRTFKKIDSTLKGNWIAEILAVLDELRLKAAVIAPAFPALGRRIVDGQLRLLVESNVERIAVRTSRPDENPSSICYVSLQDLRRGPKYLAERIVQTHSVKPLFMVDGDVSADLDIVAHALELLGESVLAAGSGGLAASVARRTNRASHPRAATASENALARHTVLHNRIQQPIIVFVGSSNSHTHAQVELLLKSKTAREEELEAASLPQIREYLKSGRCVVVHVRWEKEPENAISALLEECQRSEVSSFVLTGGDTAQLVCDGSGARGIWAKGEISPGIPWGQFGGGPFDGISVATKAGGFGEPDSLIRIVSFLEGLASRRMNSSSAEPGFSH